MESSSACCHGNLFRGAPSLDLDMTRAGSPSAPRLGCSQKRLGLRQRMFYGANQLRYFRGAELPVVAFRHSVGIERSQFHSLHLFDGMAHRQQIPPKQIAADARELRFVPGIWGIFSGRVRGAQRKNLTAQRMRETFHLRFAEAALHFDPICLWQGYGGFQHAAREFAVVGQKNRAARGIIETPNRERRARIFRPGNCATCAGLRGPPAWKPLPAVCSSANKRDCRKLERRGRPPRHGRVPDRLWRRVR